MVSLGKTSQTERINSGLYIIDTLEGLYTQCRPCHEYKGLNGGPTDKPKPICTLNFYKIGGLLLIEHNH